MLVAVSQGFRSGCVPWKVLSAANPPGCMVSGPEVLGGVAQPGPLLPAGGTTALVPAKVRDEGSGRAVAAGGADARPSGGRWCHLQETPGDKDRADLEVKMAHGFQHWDRASPGF